MYRLKITLLENLQGKKLGEVTRSPFGLHDVRILHLKEIPRCFSPPSASNGSFSRNIFFPSTSQRSRRSSRPTCHPSKDRKGKKMGFCITRNEIFGIKGLWMNWGTWNHFWFHVFIKRVQPKNTSEEALKSFLSANLKMGGDGSGRMSMI